MPNTQSQRRWEPTEEVRAAAKARLPLKLPRPDETGLRGASSSFPASHLKIRPTSPATARPHRRLIERQVEWPESDEDLESLARQVLLQSGISGFARLQLEVRDRVAVLRGALPTDFERQLALQLVRRVQGLERVDHEISTWEAASPENQERQTAKKFRRWLNVAVIGGILALIGLGWVLSL